MLVTSSIFRPLMEGVYIMSLSAYGLFPVFHNCKKFFKFYRNTVKR